MQWLAHKQLRSKSAKTRRQAIAKLRRSTPGESAALLTRFLHEDPDPNVRAEAALVLGDIESAMSVNALVEALKDSSDTVRVAVAQSLQTLADPAACDGLVTLLETGPLEARRLAAQTLKSLGWQPKKAEEEALYLVARGQFDRAAMVGHIALRPLASLLKHSAYQIRVATLNALATLGAVEASSRIVPMLRDADSIVRTAAANALDRVGEKDRM